MKYILEFLKEQVGIQPVEGAKVNYDEEFEGEVPIGYRLVINDRETDIVIWYADLNNWIVRKFEKLQDDYNELQNDYHKLMRMLPNPEPDDDKQYSMSEY